MKVVNTRYVLAKCPECKTAISVAVSSKPVLNHREGEILVDDYKTDVTCPNCGAALSIEHHRRHSYVVPGVETQQP